MPPGQVLRCVGVKFKSNTTFFYSSVFQSDQGVVVQVALLASAVRVLVGVRAYVRVQELLGQEQSGSGPSAPAAAASTAAAAADDEDPGEKSLSIPEAEDPQAGKTKNRRSPAALARRAAKRGITVEASVTSKTRWYIW